jgi:N-acetylglucosamine-6-sulfatase
MPAQRKNHLMSAGIVLLTGILAVTVLQGPALEGTPAVAEPTAEERPNIVMVMADDMRADDLRFMPTVRQQLRARGLTFRNSFSPYPLCCPARASFLTGQYAHNHDVLGNQAPFGFGAFDDSETLATSLRAAGYNTGFVGKYLNGYGNSPSKVTGLPSLGYVPPGWTDWYAAVQPPNGSGIRGNTYNYMRTPYNINGTIDASHAGEYQTETLGRFARTLTRKYAGSDQPFFLFMTPLAPHNGKPREKGDDLGVRPIRPGTWGTPARPRWTRHMFEKLVRTSPGLPKDGGPSEADISDKPAFLHMPELTRAEKRAETLVTRQRGQALFVLDREIGRLIATLDAQGELDSTVLMFTSDNGYLLGEHRIRQGKSHAYEPSIRVPLVLAGPGVPFGIRNDPATTFDVSATILDLAGAESPHEADAPS